MKKEITVVFYGRSFPRDDWRYELDTQKLAACVNALAEEFGPLGIQVNWQEDAGRSLRSGDTAICSTACASVRHRTISPISASGTSSAPASTAICCEDIRRGVSRVAFAPEMIEPEETNKRVCHNCGCGC